MEAIQTYENKEIELKKCLVRVGDLINSDGPLLSLFLEVKSNELYIFDWIDSEDLINRWLIFKVDPKYLNYFLHREISYKELFNTILNNNNFYIADISVIKISEFEIYRIKSLPSDYIPTELVYFEKDWAKNYNDIIHILNQVLFKDRSENRSSINTSINSFNNWELLKLKNELFSNLNQTSISSIEKEASLEITNFLYITSFEKIETQKNVRENNRLPEKEGMELYSQ